jgi:maleylacetoacetate isomerase
MMPLAPCRAGMVPAVQSWLHSRIAVGSQRMNSDLVLYDYWRSSASYRVRIALQLKGLPCELRPVHLLRDGGQQHAADYRVINPQQLVPCLLDGERVITQSLAIIEYLDELHPAPALLPADARGRAQVRALAMSLVCDAHPLGNLRVLQRLGSQFGADEAQQLAWSRHWFALALQALEVMLVDSAATGRYCYGDTPGLADACLVPQCYNALRRQLSLEDYPTVQRIYQECLQLEAFQRAAPERQSGAE